MGIMVDSLLWVMYIGLISNTVAHAVSDQEGAQVMSALPSSEVEDSTWSDFRV